jgi:hypothetical protein
MTGLKQESRGAEAGRPGRIRGKSAAADLCHPQLARCGGQGEHSRQGRDSHLYLSSHFSCDDLPLRHVIPMLFNGLEL